MKLLIYKWSIKTRFTRFRYPIHCHAINLNINPSSVSRNKLILQTSLSKQWNSSKSKIYFYDISSGFDGYGPIQRSSLSKGRNIYRIGGTTFQDFPMVTSWKCVQALWRLMFSKSLGEVSTFRWHASLSRANEPRRRRRGRGGGGGGGGWREITQMRNDHQAIGRTSVSAGSRRFATSATEDIHVRTTIAGVGRCSFFNAETHGEAHLKRTQCLGIFLGRWKKGWSE